MWMHFLIPLWVFYIRKDGGTGHQYVNNQQKEKQYLVDFLLLNYINCKFCNLIVIMHFDGRVVITISLC